MYDSIKLEKGLYNLSGKTFTQALTELDPDSGYADTDMAGLDAYERQLKRFDIKVSGDNADTVEKFFRTTETAVLFPEFVKRAIASGMTKSVLSEIVAAKTAVQGSDYRSLTVTESNTPYTTGITESSEIPETSIKLSGELLSLVKYGRMITTTYEAIRQQRLDVFAVTLCSIGKNLSNAVAAKAIEVLANGVIRDDMNGETFTYEELVAFWGKFSDKNLTTIIASPKVMAKILSFEQMKYACVDFMETGCVKTPFGAVLVKSTALSDDEIIGIDNSCALEMVTGSEVILETDRLIDRQIDRTAVSVAAGFVKIIKDATRVLTVA